MNQIYSLVLNHATGACQAVSEVAKGSHKAASATSGESCSPRRSRLASACLIALATLAGTSAWAQNTSGSITGAPGTNGSPGVLTGTNGTAGADAVQTISDGTHSGVLTGGVGGNGGSSLALGGDGGSGGAGLSNAVNNVGVYNTGSIQGGQGGNGGNVGIGLTPGLGGAGGNGVLITAPTRLFINDGIIEGGRGGLGGPTSSAGGVGVSATVATSFESSGTVRGGLSGDGLSRADAIRFTGGNSFLGLVSTSVIEGNVVGSLSNSDTLGLSGSTDASFNTALIGPTAQYRNFAGFQKLGSNTWTLTGSTTALTPWQIFSGTLAISSDANLGDAAGVLTLNGGTLRSTADIITNRAMVLGQGSTLETDTGTKYTSNGVMSGPGKLTKAGQGTAIFTADNTYTGGTTITAGTLELGNGGTIGSIVGNVANSGTLAFNRSDAAAFDGAISGAGNVQQRGTGTTTLTGANTYTGGTTITAGTLALGNGGTTGTITGDVANSGTLAFNRSDAAAFDGAISGAGNVQKRGTGTTTLTGANTYTGGTTITAGTLALGNGGTTGTIAGNVANSGTLAFNRSDAAAFDGAISGAGNVQQRGTGTTTLTGANTYTGGTTITAGTLALGNGGTTGTITGNVANSGTLAFNRSDAAAFDGAISGTGSVEQRGTGTTTLSGVNTYSGGTSVLNGTLAGGAASLGSGAIVNNAALVIDQAGDGSLNNVLSGAGRITKTGAGALTLGGNSAAFAGSTQVTAGMLAVNGSLGGAVTVGNGARLAGTGSVGNTAVQSGATVAPGGNSIGTLNVAGNLTLAQGSVYQLNAASDGRSDQLRVSGVAALQGGNVSVLASGNFQPTTTYSILTANGGVSGQFAGATTDMAFLNPSLTYSPQNVTLRLQRNQVSLQNIAQTPNQRAAAGALSALDTGPLYSAIVQLNAANARTAFDSLSGEVHASLKSAAFEDSRFVRNASLGRLRESFDTPAATATDAPAASGSGVWVQAVDSWGSTDADGNASSLERTTRGIFLGADTRVGDDWRVGVLGGYSKSRVTPDDLPSLAKTDTYHVGVYGGKQWGQLGLRAGATYSAGKADTRRDIAFPGFSGQTTAKYDINTTQAFGELGWKMPMANGSLEPFAGLAHVKLSTDGFTESGGVAGLSGSNSSTHATYSTLGLRGTTNAGMPNNQTRLRGLVGWRHAFGDVTPTSALALAGQPGFSVAGVPIARNALVLEGGIDFAVSRNLTMGVSYVGQASSQVSDHGIKASLLWKF
ncbi:autotransporter domain-containing protein [Polaromonas sp. CG_23.6]|uniref:autotransporter domain-containing protein n=3 Tax=Polaromonas TaxID=52972 RepID=UPI0024763C48|nr:autotransporter domain-containing protein [Polaromonas sp. CG_23.6]MDH6182858.1 outer membrane autotransporter protein [Polaromonas sp. CG_23.6]